ncbi:hypothetical protein SDC9_140144 [bioreactor metagenome]|uniref:Uncharacterized protein n=1 Tax=bioreactor metagenome TaxID=1076179 RepID=A0A645DV46_9ZZZZ
MLELEYLRNRVGSGYLCLIRADSYAHAAIYALLMENTRLIMAHAYRFHGASPETCRTSQAFILIKRNAVIDIIVLHRTTSRD